MYVAASTRSFADKPFAEACTLISDLEYDKVELWLSDSSEGLKIGDVAADPERCYSIYRDTTRLTPVALYLEQDVDADTFSGLSKFAKMLRVAQVTVPAAPMGTPFNTEIDRLRALLQIGNRDGVRVSIKTQSDCLTADPHTAVELCQSVRGLGLTLDPSYYTFGAQRPDSYDQVFPFVFHTHLRDTSVDELQIPVGLGEIDYNRLITHLARENYNRALSVDLLPGQGEIDRPLEMRKLRMLLETLL